MKIGEMQLDDKVVYASAIGYVAGWALQGVGVLVIAIILVILWKKKKE